MIEEARRDLVDSRGAAGATVFPARVEHEVVDDQLPSALEHVEEAGRARRPFEHVIGVDLDHREVPPIDVERVARSRERLLLDEKVLARRQPFISGRDLRKSHRVAPWVARRRGCRARYRGPITYRYAIRPGGGSSASTARVSSSSASSS